MIDLHCHSIYSDGTFTPTQLIAEAQRKNLRGIALTDHDTIGGIKEFLEAGAKTGMTIIPGIELASRDETGGNYHIVGLFINPDSPVLQDFLKQILQWRLERNQRIIANLQKLNIKITLDDVKQIASDPATIGRPHFAECLTKMGYVRDSRQAFAKFLDRSRPGYSSRRLPSPKECIDIIHAADGIAIWAHPFSNAKMTISGFRALVNVFAELGMDGAEAIYPIHTPNQRKMSALILKENNMLPSGGTDFHGAVFPELELGSAYGPFQVPNDFLQPLIERVKHRRTLNALAKELAIPAENLMLDQVICHAEDNSANATRMLNSGDPIFHGHFPQRAMLPGVLQIAAMTQTAKAFLVREKKLLADELRIVKLNRVRFKRQAVPGMTLQIAAQCISMDNETFSFKASICENDEIVSSANFTFATKFPQPPVFNCDKNRKHNFTLTKQDLIKLIPHRPPFVMIDGAEPLGTGNEATGYKTAPPNGKFPDYLQIEAAAQLGCAHIMAHPQFKGKIGMFLAIDEATFYRTIQPEDEMLIQIKCDMADSFALADAIISVNHEIASTASFKVILAD